MEWLLKTGSNAFYFLTILGGIFAGWIVIGSFGNLRDGPDFSAVIAVTVAIIPYCIARSFDGIRANDYPPKVAPGPTCRFCAKPISGSEERCPHCKTKLT